MKRMLVVVAIATLAGASAARAQFPADVQRGQRVRVWLPEPYTQMNGPMHRQLLRGDVQDVVGDTLRLSVPGAIGTLAVSRASIRRLEISRGKPSRVASMLERGIGGAIVGALTAFVSSEAYSHYFETRRSVGDATLAGAAWGGGIGAAIGLVLPTERWRRIRLPR
jgi:hypothetical protein